MASELDESDESPSIEILSPALDSMREGAVVANAAGELTYFNHAAKTMIGIGLSDAGNDWSRIYGTYRPDGKTRIATEDLPLARALGGESVDSEPIFVRNAERPDGLHILVSARPVRDRSGKFCGAIATFRDVSLRREIEAGLTQSETAFQRLIENSPDGVVVHRAGRIVFVNRALLAMLGHDDAAGLIGENALDVLVHPDDANRVADGIERAEADAPLRSVEMRCKTIDGGSIECEATAIGLLFERRISTLVTFRDLSARKRIEARLQISERMASVGTLAAGIAHEINNPLAYIVANLDVCEEQLREIADDSPSSKLSDLLEALAETREGAERVRSIVTGLTTFSRTDETRTVIDLHQTLEVASNMSSNEVRHRARLERSLGPVPMVKAAEAQLAQVFINLLVNAAQALPEGEADKHTISVSTSTDSAGNAVVRVEDDGRGVAANIRKRVFDPFFTTKPVGEGTGLGLFICHQTITALGGTMSLDDSELGGAKFQVVLPPAAEGATVSPQLRVDPPSSEPGGRLLIVDDEPLVRKSLTRAFKLEHEVSTASGGHEALERIRAGEHFDVILCDLMMPDMSGMQLHAKLVELDHALADRMIFATGGTFSSTASDFLARVENPRVKKPTDVRTLRALVRSVMSSRPRSAQRG